MLPRINAVDLGHRIQRTVVNFLSPSDSLHRFPTVHCHMWTITQCQANPTQFHFHSDSCFLRNKKIWHCMKDDFIAFVRSHQRTCMDARKNLVDIFFRVCAATLHACVAFVRADRKKIVHFEITLIVFPRVGLMLKCGNHQSLSYLEFAHLAVGR